jgi:hypothetical protein
MSEAIFGFRFYFVAEDTDTPRFTPIFKLRSFGDLGSPQDDSASVIVLSRDSASVSHWQGKIDRVAALAAS